MRRAPGARCRELSSGPSPTAASRRYASMARWTAAIQRDEAALAELRIPDQQAIRRQVRQQEAGPARASERSHRSQATPASLRGTGRERVSIGRERAFESQDVAERQGRDRTGRRQLQRRIHDPPDLGQGQQMRRSARSRRQGQSDEAMAAVLPCPRRRGQAPRDVRRRRAKRWQDRTRSAVWLAPVGETALSMPNRVPCCCARSCHRRPRHGSRNRAGTAPVPHRHGPGPCGR